MFEDSCWKCHGAVIQLSKLDLRTQECNASDRFHIFQTEFDRSDKT